MEAKTPKPTRLTLFFYAAFAASFVQDRYTSPDFYRWFVGEWFQIALGLLILATFLTLVFGALTRALRQGRLPWAHAACALGALVLAELIWRYGINSLPGLGFKDVAVALDIAKPLVVAAGLAAIVSERTLRRRRTPPEGDGATI